MLAPRQSISCAGSRSSDCLDRKSTRLNSSHLVISYAVFCLKKKKKSPMTLGVTLDHRARIDDLDDAFGALTHRARVLGQRYGRRLYNRCARGEAAAARISGR